MNDISICYYHSPVGELIIGIYDDKVCLIDWRYRKQRTAIDQRICNLLNSQLIERPHKLQLEVIHQLEKYFASSLTSFNIPLLPVGSNFQLQVWKELLKIPYRQTVSYLSLSRKLGNTNIVI